MAERLANGNVALALLANTLATGAAQPFAAQDELKSCPDEKRADL
jgi:hypothetical protein